MLQGCGRQVWQVAGHDQPCRFRVRQLRGANSGGRPFNVAAVHDLREALAQWVSDLVRANRNECLLRKLLHQVHGAFQLRLFSIADGGLVAAHARTATAGQHQPEQRRTHARTLRLNVRLPPVLPSNRTGPIWMSCDSALHMS